jgi:hypothetical protein
MSEENSQLNAIPEGGEKKSNIGDQLENYDLSEPKSLIQRLGDYAIVNQALATYGYIKNSNALLNAGLTSAENATAVAVAYTAPVIVPRVQPILSAVDAKFGLEQKGNQLLDLVENKAAVAAETLQQATSYVSSTKNSAQEKILEIPHKSYEILVDAPLEQLLERLEELVNRFLPPTFEVERVDASEVAHEPSKLERATHLGHEVPKRLVNLAKNKYKTLHLTEDQLARFSFLIDLVQYAVETIDSSLKKAKESEMYATAVNKLSEGKDKVYEIVQEGKHRAEDTVSDVSTKIKENAINVNQQYVSPLRQVIENRLSEIRQSELRTYAGVMAAIAHASELAKQQLYMKLENSKNLVSELEGYLDSSKKAIQNFDKQDLAKYAETMKTNAIQALSAILSLIKTYVPEDLKQKIPSVENIGTKLETWRQTIEERLLALNLEKDGGKEPTESSPRPGKGSEQIPVEGSGK